MSTLETHEAEQAEITARCEAGTCEHPHCHILPQNHVRAERAAEALRKWCCVAGESDGASNIASPETFADLLTDLMHFANREGVDFAEAILTASINHEAEIEGWQ